MRDRWTVREVIGVWRASAKADDAPRLDDAQAALLRNARDEGDVPYLVDALGDPAQRARAAATLGKLGSKDAVPALVGLLDSADWSARSDATIALSRIADRSTMDRLAEVARNEPFPATRAWAAEALGKIGDPAAAPVLVGLLSDPEFRVRIAAALALARLDDPRGAEELRRVHRAQRFAPPFVRSRWPAAPARLLTAIAIGTGWVVATVLVAGTLTGWQAWAADLLVVIAGRELWRRARERAAFRRGILSFDGEVKLRGSDCATIVLTATVATVVAGVLWSWTPALLSLFFLGIWVGRDCFERSLDRASGTPR